jgi:hypothetical protein
MQATARMTSVVSSTFSARWRLIRIVSRRYARYLIHAMKRPNLIVAIVSVALLFASPILARIGSWSQLASWSPPSGTAFGLPHPISLRIEEYVAYIDVLRLYPQHRIIVTDGGYAYIHEFEIPSTSPHKYALDCQVTWLSDAVEVQMRSGEKLVIPSTTLIQQMGQ